MNDDDIFYEAELLWRPFVDLAGYTFRVFRVNTHGRECVATCGSLRYYHRDTAIGEATRAARIVEETLQREPSMNPLSPRCEIVRLDLG